jgi:hypothetical protein
MSARRLAAAAVVAATVGMNAGTLWILLATEFLGRYTGPGITDIYVLILDLAIVAIAAVTVSYVFVGFLLAGRRGAGRISAVLLLGGALFAAVPFGYSVGGELVFHVPHSGLADAVFLLGPLSLGPGYALILPGLALVFPTGRLPSRRWVLPVGLVASAMAAGTVLQLVLPGPIVGEQRSHNPFGIEGLPASLEAAAQVLSSAAEMGVMVVGVAAVLIRYRGGDALLRQQFRWFIAAVMLAAVPLAIGFLPGFGGPHWLLLASLGLLLVPISVGIAVTRHRLYEIDRLISRGLAWGAVTVLVLSVYACGVLLLQGLLGGVTQGETVAVAGSTLLAAALFQPLRRRVQSLVDHRFNRARYDAERTTTDFAERVRDEVDLDHLRTTLATTAGGAVNPAAVGVWLRSTSGSRP